MRKPSFAGIRYLAGSLAALFCLWVSHNAIVQTLNVVPGETPTQVLRSLLLGRSGPGSIPCDEAIHNRYQAPGPDGSLYPTWHPPYDPETGCSFGHEHGSDPQAYLAVKQSGMPLFGYTSSKAGIQEPHNGYKVFVANDDLNGRAWMITLNQDTSDPGRVLAQFHTLDWHISSLSGETLVDIHVMADFGFAIQSCSGGGPIPGTEPEPRYTDSGHPRRIVLTTNCAVQYVYEGWEGAVKVSDVFFAKPRFVVENPATAIDQQDLDAFWPTCMFRPLDEGCQASGNPWAGNQRSVVHPGQWVKNDAQEGFYTDPTGLLTQEEDPRAIWQYVTRQPWDTRQCCGNSVVFRIQSFSGGVYIADPGEPPSSAVFSVGLGE